MTLPRVLSAVGRTLAMLGTVMLLFAAYQLWGTGLQQAQAQSNLQAELAKRFELATEAGAGIAGPPVSVPADRAASPPPAEDAAAEDPPTHPDGAPNDAAPGGATAAMPGGGADALTADRLGPESLPERPTALTVVAKLDEPATARSVARLVEPEVAELLSQLYPADGEALARLIIPSIGVDEIVVAGVGTDDLRKGPGHYGNTPLPGQPGNAALAGHRTTYGSPFGRIDELRPGDIIYTRTMQGLFTYRVTDAAGDDGIGHRIVAPTALEVLADHGDNRLTLTSCHPKYSSRQRIIVHAELEGPPVVRLPRPGEPVSTDLARLGEPEAPAGEPEAVEPSSDPQAAAGPDPAADVVDPGPTNPDSADTRDNNDSDAGDASNIGAPGRPEGVSAPATAGSQPADPPGASGFGEGLSGDQGAIGPAVLWGLAALAVWSGGWLWGRSGRRALRYSVTGVGFLIVLYVMFTYVDRALPAY